MSGKALEGDQVKGNRVKSLGKAPMQQHTTIWRMALGIVGGKSCRMFSGLSSSAPGTAS